MRILQVIYSLTQGGAERFVVDLSNELANTNDVYLLTLRNDLQKNNGFFKSEISDQVKYINLSLNQGFRLSDFWRINKIVYELKPSIIHAHSDTIYYFLLTSLISKKIKVVHTIHSDAFYDGRKIILSKIRKYFYKFQKIIPITISDKSKDSFNRFYNLNVSILIYNGRKQLKKSSQFLEVKNEIYSLKKSPSDLVFLHVSRFNEISKNHKLLLSVFNKLCQEHDNLLLIIIGKDFNTLESKYLTQMANKKTFFLGEKPNVADYLLNSDAICLTSNFEGLPISLLEALSCGVVPICTAVGGIPDVIEDGKTGFLSKEINEQSYLKTMKKFINNPNQINRTDLIQHFENNFSIEICAANHIKLYTKVKNIK